MKTRTLTLTVCCVALFMLTTLGQAQDAASPRTAKAKSARNARAPRAPQAAAATGATSHTTGVAAALPAGNFKPLFDGKTLAGWIQYPADTWVVKAGAMASTGGPRGFIYTKDDYDKFRLIFKMRHLPAPQDSGKKGGDHQACVLIFCTRPPAENERGLDALGGIQFQPPNGGSWDYRPGRNDGGKKKGSNEPSEFTRVAKPRFDPKEWSQVELLVSAKDGTARMAVAQPVGTKAIVVLDFKDPAAGKKGPIAWQIHNGNLFDEYKDVQIEVNPAGNELLTTK